MKEKDNSLNKEQNGSLFKTKCPHCHKEFIDCIKRYGIGVPLNTVRVVTNGALQIGLGMAGGIIHKQIGYAGSELGKRIAESIGCGEEDIKIEKHRCPYCGFEWE